MTVYILEISPDVILYFPPLFRSDECDTNPEEAYISNKEAVAHIKEIAQVSDSFFYFVTRKCNKNDDSVLCKSLRDGETQLISHHKTRIIKLPSFDMNAVQIVVGELLQDV